MHRNEDPTQQKIKINKLINSKKKKEKKEVDLFIEKHAPQTECGPSQKVRGPEIWCG